MIESVTACPGDSLHAQATMQAPVSQHSAAARSSLPLYEALNSGPRMVAQRKLLRSLFGRTAQLEGSPENTLQRRQGVSINDDATLEREADVMGAQALQRGGVSPQSPAEEEDVPDGVASRVVDPAFASHLAGGATVAERKDELRRYYDEYVEPEFARVSGLPIEEALLEDARFRDLQFRMFMMNSSAPDEIEALLNLLVDAVNTSAIAYDDHIDEVAGERFDMGEYATEPQVRARAQDVFRDERKKRAGAKTRAGTTQERDLRGVRSRTEATTLLDDLHGVIAGVVGGGALGSVGVRGSSVTGVRSRNNEPFEPGIDAHQEVSDASDLDFFFTCPTLSARLQPAQTNAGVMNSVELLAWLALPGNLFPQAAALGTALAGFSTRAQALTGRKCDVVLIGGATAGTLAGDAGTLIR